MCDVRRTAESNKAKRMPISDPVIHALKASETGRNVTLVHYPSAGMHIEGVRATL